jgi:recombination DNA repair RAD52 pathway protein
MGLSPEQYVRLRGALNGTRVAKRSQGGKQLSYLESWDVRAHLIRMFGYGNFDINLIDQHLVGTREYMGGRDNDKEMVECSWFAKVELVIRDEKGYHLCTYSDAAIGSTSGPRNMIGEHHDNAMKTAASDALKRCAINLGTQFGLSLYDDGTTRDVVRGTLVKPEGYEEPTADDAKEQLLKTSLGATRVEEDGATTTTEGNTHEDRSDAGDGGNVVGA